MCNTHKESFRNDIFYTAVKDAKWIKKGNKKGQKQTEMTNSDTNWQLIMAKRY